MSRLKRAIEDLKSEAVPEIDWDKSERALLEAIERGARPRFTAPRARANFAWPGLAVAAVLLLAVGIAWRLGSMTENVEPVAPPLEAVHREPLVDGPSLRARDRISAAAGDVTVDHPGLARWTLTQGSEAKMVVNDRAVTVELVGGRLVAEVVPGVGDERFAVEIGETRVAVRGTVFSVELRDGRVHVEVTEGRVSVGSRSDRSASHGTSLTAPARGTFLLDGALVRDSARDTTGPARLPDTPGAGKQPLPRTAPPGAPRAADGGTAQTVADAVEAAARACFAEHTESPQGTRVTARTSIRIQMSAEGRVSDAGFDPPLSPAVQRCVSSSLGSLRAAESPKGFAIERTIDLGE